MKTIKISPYLFFLLTILLSSCEKDDYITEIVNYKNSYNAELVDSNLLYFVVDQCVNSSNKDKSVAIFGGSLSVRDESEAAKYFWHRYLNMKITDYGRNGYGFSSQQGSIQDQVDKARKHDIYILWASTNDYSSNRPAGSFSDYTITDNFDNSKRITQCGGINYCIKTLKDKYPDSKIYLFGSLKYFLHDDGYNIDSKRVNETGFNFFHYIQLQKQCAENQNIKFFNQFNIPVLKKEYAKRFYLNDLVHMSEDGYANIGLYQLYFLATENELQE